MVRTIYREYGMAARLGILKALTESRNSAVERAVELALADASPAQQIELADVLLERNRRSGWVALIRAYDRLEKSIQKKVVARPRDLFGPLAETMQDFEGPARENVITIVQACADARLVYLLAEALMDARPEVRELAGKSFLEAIRRYCDRSEPAARGGGAERVLDQEEVAQVNRAVDFALRKYKSHRQPLALHAAFIHERQLDSPIWNLFQDPYDDLTRAATVMLRAPSEASLAPALLLALGSALKPAALAGLASVELSAIASAVAAQSFRLLDPPLREAVRGLQHMKLLPALRKEPPWNVNTWSAWLRLIEIVGLQAADKLNWLVRMFESAPAGVEGSGWKVCVLRAIAETGQIEAGTTLAQAVQDADERVARVAARYLLHKRVTEWRDLAVSIVPKSPHLSVRRLANGGMAPLPRAIPALPGVRESASAKSFNKAWSEYSKMPPAVQHNTARSVATDPAFAEQLRNKLTSGSPQEAGQGLKMLVALPDVAAFRKELIGLCGHKDPRVAALAVRLIGRLEDPKLKDLLEAATRHGDPRVRANAVESMEELHIADRSQQVLAMLNSRHSRERANAIKAIGHFDFATARECLGRMLTDANPLHRMSALWVVEQLQMLEIMRQVSILARRDPNLRVRKRALEMLETLSGSLQSPS